MSDTSQSPLGKVSAYVDQYTPALLCPIARQANREAIGVGARPLFFGADLWTAYELSWLGPRGKPEVAMAQFLVPAESTHLIESKSLKLYLNSFNQTRFDSAATVRDCLVRDLSQAAWGGGAVRASVSVTLIDPDAFDAQHIHELDGVLLDRLDAECSDYHPAPERLSAALDEAPVEETLISRLLKSNCLVTGQPDWGSVQVRYTGPQIDQLGLLQYIVSFRQHTEFHEQCVERMFMDIWQRCKPQRLTVYARYTRRGGLDINPFRTSHPGPVPVNVRTARQ
ncbi:NADPH-dependent 7-cyano-7-deazaguanine reductase QueF [Comamonas serinivorans]|uniref:NADPH-dependent 7-cyano-7-deazaguanine reductase n=1 Tax=Comamonas serinivorans TaxID=1082851 RepID=A0A1Y0ENW3_9BURK|nr:NADPH-dependent 7-cyano-7-deazaguanine reductase QueF [Comamonas serinivorans]ARU05324.1 NADPH-dependent 7-cyano-7-deazaguanine reductase QueF [Comamonas serinivorans]